MNLNPAHMLFIISSPSAGGKTTIMKRLISLLDGSLTKVITCTTRAAREGEKPGIDYRFFSSKEFDAHLKEGNFAESAEVYGNKYGVLKSDLFAPGNKIISLDSKGIKNFRRMGIEGTYVLITPPSIEVLKERLYGRDQNTKEDIAIRLAEAEKELAMTHLYDHVIVNDDLETAVSGLKEIILGARDEKTK